MPRPAPLAEPRCTVPAGSGEAALHFATLFDARAWVGRQRLKCRSVCPDWREGYEGGWKIAATPAELRLIGDPPQRPPDSER